LAVVLVVGLRGQQLVAFVLEKIDQLREAAFIEIADGRFAVRLDPFGLLHPEIVVDCPLQLGVGANLARERLVWQR